MKTSNSSKSKIISDMMKVRLAIILGTILLALVLLGIKLYTIQNDYSEEYNQKILSQQRYDSREIPYRRGDIIDRNGTYLATSTKIYNLILDPSQINTNQEAYLEPTVNLLCEIFGFDEADVRNTIFTRSDSQYVRYAKALSYDQKELFETRKAEINEAYKAAGDSRRVYGIWFEDGYTRVYPNNDIACNVVGFAINDAKEGSGGIEQYYNSELIGTSGREYGYLNDDSNLERVIKSAKNGNTIVSTIDVNIQSVVQKYLKQFEQDMGSKTAACIVMDPDTGEVLAMASNRTFDLNDPRNLDGLYTEEEIAAMTDQELSDAWNTNWRNFCISDTYEPGSTSKIFTVSSALDNGIISGDETYYCDGIEIVSEWPIKCNNVNGHGWLTVTESLMQSCNDAMMQIAAKIGKEKFCDSMKLFGFGTKTGIDLPGEADTSSLVYQAKNMVASDLATNAFGQNYNCTMIQMAAAYCSVINGGSYFEPHVVKQILNAEGSLLKEYEPKPIAETVSSQTSSFIRHALKETVENGTGAAAFIDGYSVAGKTGTAEKYPRGEGNYLVSFCGFAPADDPEVLVYVIIDEPHAEEQAKSSYATKVFRNIIYDILPYIGVFKDGETGYTVPSHSMTKTEEQLAREEIEEVVPIKQTSETESSETGSSETKPSETGREETEQPETSSQEKRQQETEERESVPESTISEEEKQRLITETLPGNPAGIEYITPFGQ